AAGSDLETVRAALAAERWDEAHQALSAHFASGTPRFVVTPRLRSPLVERIRAEFPDAVRQAAARAARLLRRESDLLGYRSLRFGDRAAAPDWHLDPVHDRRAPLRFWASVPYLDSACGDHKIIWELNRH